MQKIILILASCTLLVACSSDFDDEWKRDPYVPIHFNKLVVVGLSHEIENRKFYEEEAVSQLENAGFHAIKGLSIFPQTVTEEAHNQDSISRLIVAHEVDAVLVIKILHENDHSYMMPEDHKRFKVFYGRWGRSKSLHTVGRYYKRPDKYFMIATLYNVKEQHQENEETVIWRAASQIYNPEVNIKAKIHFIDDAVAHITDQHLIE